MELEGCLGPSILRGIPSVDQIILAKFTFAGPSGWNNILRNYPKIRDFHHNPPYLAPLFHFNNFIAESINFTLLSEFDAKSNCSEGTLSTLPRIHSMVRAHQLRELYNESLSRIKVKPSAVQRYPQPFSFTYCDHPRREFDTLSPLIIFQNTADILIWFCMLASILLVGIFVKRLSGPTNSPTLLVALSSLVSGGVSISSKSLKRSWLLTTWMYACIILVTYFSGHLTSHVISPSPEFRFSNLNDLMANNYSLIQNPFSLMYIKRELSSSGSPELKKILWKLVTTALVAKDEHIPKLLATKPNTATIFIWPHAFKTINLAQEFQKARGVLRKHCYVGKELLFDESLFVGVISPKIKKLTRTLRVLMEQGIFHVWIQEYVGISGSIRVQGRSRIKSSTKFREDAPMPTNLSINDGKIKNVFVLWMIDLTICGVSVLVEKIVNVVDIKFVNRFDFLLKDIALGFVRCSRIFFSCLIKKLKVNFKLIFTP